MKIKIEKQNDGTYIAYNITGDNVQIIGTGETVAEAKDDFLNSIAEMKESVAADGDAMPKELLEDLEFNFEREDYLNSYAPSDGGVVRVMP